MAHLHAESHMLTHPLTLTHTDRHIPAQLMHSQLCVSSNAAATTLRLHLCVLVCDFAVVGVPVVWVGAKATGDVGLSCAICSIWRSMMACDSNAMFLFNASSMIDELDQHASRPCFDCVFSEARQRLRL